MLVATKTPTENAPVLGRGALCADSMGLVCYYISVLSFIHLNLTGENVNYDLSHSCY
jgi:hypothetical protein